MKRHSEEVLLVLPLDLCGDEPDLFLRWWWWITDFGDQVSSRSLCNTVYKDANIRYLDAEEESEAKAK